MLTWQERTRNAWCVRHMEDWSASGGYMLPGRNVTFVGYSDEQVMSKIYRHLRRLPPAQLADVAQLNPRLVAFYLAR